MSQQEYTWSDDRILDLISEIEQLRCLWDPRDKNKKSREKKRQAFKSLAEKFQVPVEEIKKKFNILLQSYRNYRRKIASKSSEIGTDSVYKPVWYAYDALDKFMVDVYTPRGSIGTRAVGEESDVSEEVDDTFTNTSLEFILSDAETSHIKEEVESVTIEHQENLRTKEFHSPKKLRKTKKRRVTVTDDPIADETYEYTLKDIDEESRIGSEKDECAIFGELVAAKLRKMDEVSRQYLMNDIHNLMFQARIRRTYKGSTVRRISVSSPTYAQSSQSSPRSN